MFDISSKAQNAADKYLKDQRNEYIKNSVFVDNQIVLIEDCFRYLSSLETVYDLKLISAKYFKGTFLDYVAFFGNNKCCCACQDQFKPKTTPEKIYESYCKNRSQTHYRSV